MPPPAPPSPIAGRRCPETWSASSRRACWPATCWTTSASGPSARAGGPAPPALAAAASPTRVHPRRWMMLPEGHGLHPGHPGLRGYIRFLNLDLGTLVRAQLPLFSDHCAIDSVDGLLLLLREEDSAVRLLHPFTGDIAELPPLSNLLPQLAPLLYNCPVPYRIRRLAGIVSASASFSSEAITVMLALHEVHHVAFATTLDQQWTLSSWKYQHGCPPPVSFQGKLYMSCYVLYSTVFEIFQIDPPVKDGVGSDYVRHPPKLIATVPEGNLIMPIYPVECDSEILLLGHKDFYMSQIVVFKLADLVLQRCIPITSIGGNTLFISERSLSVASKALPTTMR
ncbi:hypothetical protein PAHAL_6G273200 [Panicum hallii]|jgi:hypothetical protein|uniref:KIB1-4 beta-propeller domain-containing protein n=1 Tax=Panicum hallii TaxID=206008 RepID=A0A2T8IHY3_9POAL|nr:hypothetical protein PAHAL_6G273200 [Panicum hallii]